MFSKKMLARLLSDPSAMSVENLERRQRLESESPLGPNPNANPNPNPNPNPSPRPALSASPAAAAVMPPMPTTGGAVRSADELESDLKGRLNLNESAPSPSKPEPKTLMSPMAFATSQAATSAASAAKKQDDNKAPHRVSVLTAQDVLFRGFDRLVLG